MKKILPLAIGAALLTAASSAFAITDEEGNASLQFNFSAPGARSLAMGGAFIGLADDAGSGAGLRNLRERVVAAYGPDASVTLLAQQPHGVRAEIRWTEPAT